MKPRRPARPRRPEKQIRTDRSARTDRQAKTDRQATADRPAALRKPLEKPPRSDGPRHRARTEEMFHGVRACEALFARRPQEIVRVYVEEARRRHFAPLLAWCAAERRGFQVVAADNLARLTGSIHHEGVAILARQIRRRSLDELLGSPESGVVAGPLLYLDGVQNPHNLGSILRTAAHFGVAAIIGRAGDLAPLSPAAARVAEGAAEHVAVCDLVDPATDLARLKRAGWRVVVTSSQRGEPLYTARFGAGGPGRRRPEVPGRGGALPPQAAPVSGDRQAVSPAVTAGPRVVVVLGSEGEGVSRAIDAAADLRVRIPGTGTVESLNVSVAAGVVLGELWRRATAD